MPVLLILASLLGAGDPPSGSHAALLYLRGDARAARAETIAVLTKAPADGPALFVRACLELETTGPAAAEPYAARLEQVASSPPQAAVLRQLLSRRTTTPAEPIEDALAEAWKAAGRPDLRTSPLLPEVDGWHVIPKVEPQVLKRMAAPERLLFAYGDNAQDRFRAAALAADRPERNPLVVNLDILEAVAPYEPLPVEYQKVAKQVAMRVVPVVSVTDPANGYLTVAAWLASGSADSSMTGDDLALLEDAVARPRFELPRRELLEQLRTLANHLEPRYGDLWACSAALGSPLPVNRLSQRAESTRDPALRKRAGLLVSAVGKRLVCAGTLLERMFAVALASKGAKLAENGAAMEAIRADVDRSQAAMRSMTDGKKMLGTWPFAHPWREWDADREIEHFERFAGPFPASSLAALTCQERPQPQRTWMDPGAGIVRDFHRRSGLSFSPCSDERCLQRAHAVRQPAHLFEAYLTVEGTPAFKDLFVVPTAKGAKVVEFFDASRDFYGGCRAQRKTCPTVD